MPLTLTRRPGETLMIGTDITITVCGIKGNQVRLSVRAPADTVIDREEVWQRKQEEARKAEFELIKGLHVYEFRDANTDTPICWIAAERERDALALFHSEHHGRLLADIDYGPIWDSYMAHYHNTELERPQDNAVYRALLAEARDTPPAPFVVPMPTSLHAKTEQAA